MTWHACPCIVCWINRRKIFSEHRRHRHRDSQRRYLSLIRHRKGRMNKETSHLLRVLIPATKTGLQTPLIQAQSSIPNRIRVTKAVNRVTITKVAVNKATRAMITTRSRIWSKSHLMRRQSALNAKESELAARESELAFKQQNSGEPEAEEPVISVFEEIDPEKLESDGERAILGAAKQVETKFNAQLTAAEKKVTVAEQKAQAATEKSENMELESNIKETCVKYSVTRGELETAYQQSSGLVRDLDTLAKSVLFDRAAANTGQQAQAQAKNERTQGAAKVVGAQGAQGANRNTDAEPRGNLKNVFDGAEIAKHYSAFA